MRLVLSGGGTGGHIIPNIALIHELKERSSQRPDAQLELLYIGSRNGMEKKMIEDLHVPYYGISTGKLRRYFSLQNFIDVFKIPIGFVQALIKLIGFKPKVVFCKGGYVCFPLVMAARLLKIPVILHESDVTPGLANKLSARFATTICISFEESRKFFHGNKKIVLTGNPVRKELMFGNKEDGLRFVDFNEDKPILLFMGGSLGAEFINEFVWKNLDRLLIHYQVVHICGQGKSKSPEELLKLLDEKRKKNLSRYRIFNFVQQELKDLYALANVIITRAGAITLSEIDFFDKPAILIPLPAKNVSRGDQIENAKIFAKHHLCAILQQDEFTDEQFFDELKHLLQPGLKDSIPAKRKELASLAAEAGTSRVVPKTTALQKIANLIENI
jgi:UDP-N-acetylglucosamine--N-acetylmuramyl-(pentapeptide) pyrophosphoryl-undecaprenol N-acetylglucosamine transferase